MCKWTLPCLDPRDFLVFFWKRGWDGDRGWEAEQPPGPWQTPGDVSESSLWGLRGRNTTTQEGIGRENRSEGRGSSQVWNENDQQQPCVENGETLLSAGAWLSRLKSLFCSLYFLVHHVLPVTPLLCFVPFSGWTQDTKHADSRPWHHSACWELLRWHPFALPQFCWLVMNGQVL